MKDEPSRSLRPIVMLLLTSILCVAISYAQQLKWAYAGQTQPSDPVVAAAGDIACDRTPSAPPPDPDEGPGGCSCGSSSHLHARIHWHQPRFSSGHHHSDPAYDAFWQDLYAAHADLLLNRHDHLYERFNLQTPSAAPDQNGIREIIAGTGGRSHYQFTNIEPNSEARNNTTFGILEVTLHQQSYDWRFVPADNGSFSDAGSQRCHSRT